MPSSSSATKRETTSLVDQCVAICEQSTAHLENPHSLSCEEVVHQLRVATKQLRAAWHLVKTVDPKLAKTRRAALRELSAAVAGQRDHDVLLGLASQLAASSDAADAFAPLVKALTKDPESAHISPVSLDLLLEGWNAELATWRSLNSPLSDYSACRKKFRDALRKSERRARKCTRSALADRKADANVWHEWRKATKRLRYQRELIAASQGRQLGIRDARIRRLGTRLGERNDLANLILAVEDLPNLPAQQHGVIRKAIAQSERSVIRSARRLGRLAFLR